MLIEATQQYSDLVDALTQRGPPEIRGAAGADTYAEVCAATAIAWAGQKVAFWSGCPGPERLAWLLAGIGYRETLLGTSKDLDIRSHLGTGDFTARLLSTHRQGPRYQVLEKLPPGWHYPRDDKGDILPGPYVIPLDGRGWGRDPWQADYGAHPEVTDAVDAAGHPLWELPRWACNEAARRFLLDLKALGGERQTLAAYNCGVGGVRRALDAGKNVDFNTTGRDYSRWILEHLEAWGAPQ